MIYQEWERWYCQQRLRTKGTEPSASSLRSKRSHLRLAAQQVSLKCDAKALAFALADRATVEALLDDLLATHSATYVRGLCFTLISYGQWAAKVYGTSCALTKRDFPQVAYEPETDSYSTSDLDALALASKLGGFRWHLFVVMLIDTGRRLNEVLSFRYEDLRLDHAVPHIRLYASKTQQNQLVPLSKRLQELMQPEALQRLQEGCDLPWETRNSPTTHLFPFSDRSANRRFVRMADKLGIARHAVKGTRTAFITHKLAKGAPINGVAKLVGHNSLQMISKYYDKTSALTFANLLD